MPQPTPHLLLVDDETALRTVTAERLRERDFEVVEAETGEKALELLDQFAFDVLVTDLRLPGVDGRQVVNAAIGRYPAIVAIVITGYGNFKDALDAGKQGASDFVTKPFQFDELMHVLQKALEQRRLRFGKRLPSVATRGTLSIRWDPRPEPADARALPASRDRGAFEQHDLDHRRDGNRQGGGRAGHPPQ